MFYEIKAYRDPEGVVVLAYDAADFNDALQLAEAQGYRVISSKAKFAWRKPTRRYRFPLGLFSQELLALLEAGLTLLDGIETLAGKEQHPQARKVYGELMRLLREGQPLSRAMEEFPSEFPALYVATIRASEKTGDIKEALSRYLAYQEKLDAVRKKVVNAAIYPTLLMIVGGLVIVFLLAYVVPRFSHVYEGLGNNLPFMSRMLLNWGRLFQANAIEILLAGVLIIAALSYVLTRRNTLHWVSRKLWRIPAIGERMRIYQLARFYRTLGMLLRGGIPLVTALGMVSGLLQTNLRVNLHQARQAIREGQPISESLSKHGLTTEVAIRMLRVGERSGNLGEMMGRIASFYDEDIARWVEWFTRLFEPLLMIFIGLVIGTIVLLMYLPIFELAGAIQ